MFFVKSNYRSQMFYRSHNVVCIFGTITTRVTVVLGSVAESIIIRLLSEDALLNRIIACW
jgi:hypothetical protein